MINPVLSKLVFYSEDDTYILATHEQEIVSSAHVVDYGDDWNLDLLYTNPWYRQNGLAKYLMVQVCRDADRNGKDLWLEVVDCDDFKHEDLEAFYVSFGFVRVDTRFRRKSVKRY